MRSLTSIDRGYFFLYLEQEGELVLGQDYCQLMADGDWSDVQTDVFAPLDAEHLDVLGALSIYDIYI